MHVKLGGGAYQARSLAAAAQRCVNLYPEPLPEATGEPVQVADLPTAGLRLLATLPQAPVRGIHSATNGALYVVAGAGVYAVSTAWVPTLLGSITVARTNPVSMADNGLEMVIVDGSGSGWKVTLAGNAFAQIVDANGVFRGGGRVDYLDTFFLFSVPGTPQFQVSDSLALTFDPLYFANKEAFSDLLVTLIVAKREIWLLGSETTEVWYNKGGADFPFESMPGVFINRGCAAPYSVAETDNAVYWLSRDRYGAGIVLQGAGYEATRISTYAIEAELTTYPTLADAVGYTYQMAGHVFYVLNFPAADKSWSYDVTTKQWHELVWLDANGAEHRHRANCAAAGYDIVVCGDHSSGKLYALDPAAFSDAGAPIKRLRSFPHLVADGNRVFYRQFAADLETGTGATEAAAVVAATGPNFVTGDLQVVTDYSSPTQLTLSLWACFANPDQTLSFTDTGLVEFSTSFWINAHQFGFSTAAFAATFTRSEGVLCPTPVHVLFSIDVSAQTFSMYWNDAAYPEDTGQVVGGGGLDVLNDAGWTMTNPGGAGDIWIDERYVDFSDVANRRKFINADLSAVDLGANGEAPFGVAPRHFLHVADGGAAADFATNRGTAGPWGLTGGPLVADLNCGSGASGTSSDPQVFLSWSDDRGHSFGNPVAQSMGGAGEYLVQAQWQRLGMGRDRVFQLEWSGTSSTALLGAWIELNKAQS